MGRPPVPNELKERRGTSRPDRLPVVQTVTLLPAVDGVPDPPAGLRTGGKRAWADIWTAAGAWVSQGLDGALVEQACRTYDEIGQLRLEIKKHGLLVEETHASASGKVLGIKLVANPAAKMLRDAEKSWKEYLVLLAIPPTERARLGLTQVKAQSKLEALQASRGRS
jgi:P27 family predicted phage terminase small subunit